MRITYDLTIDDLLRFHDYHFASSPTVKRQIMITRIAVAAMPIALGIYFYTTGKSASSLVIGLFLAAVAYVFIGKTIQNASREQVRKMYKEAGASGQNEGLVGEHALELTEEGLTDRTTAGDAKIPWQAIDRIEKTAEDLFIFLTSNNAQVVPRTAVNEGDWGAFADAAQARLSEHRQKG